MKCPSDFAILDVKHDRAALAKLVEAGHEVPVIITGTISPGGGGIGADDGVSREFALDVASVKFGKPKFIPCDTTGRRYALADAVKPGDMLQCDGGFTCLKENAKRVVK